MSTMRERIAKHLARRAGSQPATSVLVTTTIDVIAEIAEFEVRLALQPSAPSPELRSRVAELLVKVGLLAAHRDRLAETLRNRERELDHLRARVAELEKALNDAIEQAAVECEAKFVARKRIEAAEHELFEARASAAAIVAELDRLQAENAALKTQVLKYQAGGLLSGEMKP